jgi:hypothetical protein
MTPLELLARLSALVLPPRYPLVRYHGVLAPRSSWRRDVVPKPPRAIDASPSCGTAAAPSKPRATLANEACERVNEPRARRPTRTARARTGATGPTAPTPTVAPVAPNILSLSLSLSHWNRILGGLLLAASPRIDWATLLRRTFHIDVLECPVCHEGHGAAFRDWAGGFPIRDSRYPTRARSFPQDAALRRLCRPIDAARVLLGVRAAMGRGTTWTWVASTTTGIVLGACAAGTGDADATGSDDGSRADGDDAAVEAQARAEAAAEAEAQAEAEAKPASCPSGQIDCGGGGGADCVDPDTDGENCGACGNACGPYYACMSGQCLLHCPADAGLTGCGDDAGGTCVDTQNDIDNCGACGKACPPQATCDAGVCDCGASLVLCGGACIDTAFDPNNCGACGNVCSGQMVCNGGSCQQPPQQNIVFVSSQVYAGGGLGGLAGADSQCQMLAQAAGFSGMFAAWLSDSKTDAAQRFGHWPTPYVLPDGTVVASNWSQLVSGTLAHAIDETETKGAPPQGSIGSGEVWTNTTPSGLKYGTQCGDWTQLNGSVVNFHFGDATASDGGWTLDSHGIYLGMLCGGTAALYCVQN